MKYGKRNIHKNKREDSYRKMTEGAVLFFFTASILIDGDYVHWYNKNRMTGSQLLIAGLIFRLKSGGHRSGQMV